MSSLASEVRTNQSTVEIKILRLRHGSFPGRQVRMTMLSIIQYLQLSSSGPGVATMTTCHLHQTLEVNISGPFSTRFDQSPAVAPA
jgi:hypothetical protein